MLENRADLHRELLAALAALVEAVADALGRVRLDLGDTVHAAAMRADGAVRPQDSLKMREGGFFVVKVGL